MMKPRTLLMGLLLCVRMANAQDLPATVVQQLESTTENTGEETEDDGWLQQLEKFAKHPININTAESDELKQLHFISDLQINQLLRYRKWLGPLVSLYELQAVPAWDVATIKKILPYITVGATSGNPKSFLHRFSGGEHQLMLRVSQVLEKSAGYTDTNSATHYVGSPQHLLFRYRYSYKNLLQAGILGDKDAGEAFSGRDKNRDLIFIPSIFLYGKQVSSRRWQLEIIPLTSGRD